VTRDDYPIARWRVAVAGAIARLEQMENR
jgi:hypothetical protein